MATATAISRALRYPRLQLDIASHLSPLHILSACLTGRAYCGVLHRSDADRHASRTVIVQLLERTSEGERRRPSICIAQDEFRVAVCKSAAFAMRILSYYPRQMYTAGDECLPARRTTWNDTALRVLHRAAASRDRAQRHLFTDAVATATHAGSCHRWRTIQACS